MKTFTEIREARRSAQDRLSARASKHGLGSQKRLNKIKKASDFFSKPPPSFSKDELKKMGYAVEASSSEQQAAIAIAKKADKVVNEDINSVDEASEATRVYNDRGDEKTAKGSKKRVALAKKMKSLKRKYGRDAGDEFGRTSRKYMEPGDAVAYGSTGIKKESVDEAYYRGQRKATPKKQEPTKMGSKSGSGYDLYHKSYTAALQHAYAWAKKKGHIVDPDDIDSKVASGPKKPSEGRTNSFTLKLKDNPKKMLAVQVYGMGGGKYELNTYIT
jgi:hypothetical protein